MSKSNIRGLAVQEGYGPGAPDLSVVIVSWNVRALLIDCLRALRRPEVTGGLDTEVIVVDNASTDGSAEAARSAGARVVETGANLGYGRANNIGLRFGKGRHLLVLNPDTVPQAGSLPALVSFLARQPSCGIAAPRLLNPDGSVQRAAFRFPTLVMAAIDLFPLPRWAPGRVRKALEGSRINGRFPGEEVARHPFRIDHPLGACLLIRREAYEQCGGFDPRIFMYSEEIDLALRYGSEGWECWQVPQSRVVHLGGQSTAQMPAKMFVELWRSRLWVARRHFGPVHLTALKALLALGILWDMLLVVASGGNDRRARLTRDKEVLKLAVRV